MAFYRSLIPTMTSDNSPSGIASASSFSLGRNPFMAFDKDISSNWISDNNNAWLSYEYPSPVRVSKYSIFNSSVAGSMTTLGWQFQGSMNKTDWTTLDSQKENWNWESHPLKSFEINNTEKYLAYRLLFDNAAYVYIHELEMYEIVYDHKTLISSGDETISIRDDKFLVLGTANENDFLTHGMDSSFTVPQVKWNEKTFLDSNPSPIGSGKLFKAPVDTQSTPIKKLTIS